MIPRRLPKRVAAKLTLAALLSALAAWPIACKSASPARKAETIRLATTTSLENSGLLDVLVPAFTEETGIKVHVMAMGTGRAMQTASDGNCEVLLVHAPEMEERFVEEGWGVSWRSVMYNDFVILGPAADPVGAAGAGSPAEAMKRIAGAGSVFVSRGDNSGTHHREMRLWQAAGIEPGGPWYRSVGRGMGETLTMADEMKAYVLSDRATFLRYRPRIALKALFAGGEALLNPYSVIAVNPEKHPHLKWRHAQSFVDFLTSDECRRLILGHTVDGETAFAPWPAQAKLPAAVPGVQAP